MNRSAPLDVRRIPASPATTPPDPPGQWALPLDGNLALAPAPPVPPGPALSIVPRPAAGDPRAEVLHASASRFVQALLEASAGDRPVNQMARWMTPRVYADLVERLTRVGRARTARGPLPAPRAKVVSVHVRKPTQDSAEVAARVVHGRRSRAIALRLEVRDDSRHRERWTCTALSWG